MESEGSFRIHTCPPPVPTPRRLHRTNVSFHVQGTCTCFVTKAFFTVRSCQHLTQPPSWRVTPCRLSATAFFEVFAAALHIGGRSFIHNLRTRHSVVTGTHLSRNNKLPYINICIRILSRLYKGTLFYLTTCITNSLIPFRVTTGSAVQLPTSLPRESGSTRFSSMYCSWCCGSNHRI